MTSYADPATGLVPLGDMALSLERVRAQAKEFGHSVRREAGYLSVHSVLHLLGYDHMDEGPMKRQMRAREEAIMAVLDLRREPPRVVRLRAHLKTKPEHPEQGEDQPMTKTAMLTIAGRPERGKIHAAQRAGGGEDCHRLQ